VGQREVLAAGVNVDFDGTIFLQIVLFALLGVVLKPLLFDPVLKIFTLREEKTDGARAKARQLQERAGKILRKYERELERIRQVATEERDRARVETARLEAEILGKARESVAAILNDGRKKLEQQTSAIRFDLGKESERLAQDLANRAIGRS
jgi:F-type H+-transporting ATPase subunit b